MGLRTAVIGTAGASAARVVEPVLGPSHFSTPWCGMAQVCARSGEGQREMRRCKQAHSCLPTPNSMSKRGARCGAGSRTLAFLDPLVWHDAWRKCERQRVAGGSRGGVATRTGAQESSDSGQPFEASTGDGKSEGGGGGSFLYRRMSSIGATPALPHARAWMLCMPAV